MPKISGRTKKIAQIAVPCAVVMFAMTACNIGADASKGMGDSPVNQSQNNAPANVVNFSDKYPDTEWKCNGTDAIYTNTRSAGYFVVVPNDSNCK